MIKIGFISTSNAARSILAENICKLKYPDMFEVYSAGIEPRSHLVCDTSKTLMRNYDLNPDSYPKGLEEFPVVDITILMGNDVNFITDCKHVYNFELEDPIHKLDEIFDLTCRIIELKLELLVRDINDSVIVID